jgi:hypothetical protein
VEAVVFAAHVECPVRLEVSVVDDSAEAEDGLGALDAPPGAGRNASNPGIVELTVAACNPAPGTKATMASDPELWAALVHQLRRAPDYRDTLGLPLQMHLAKLTEEYVLPHDPDAD